jgi:hypothetical protein
MLINHFDAFQKKIPSYFKDADVSAFEWVIKQFSANNVSWLTTCEPKQLMGTSLKDMFWAE